MGEIEVMERPFVADLALIGLENATEPEALCSFPR